MIRRISRRCYSSGEWDHLLETKGSSQHKHPQRIERPHRANPPSKEFKLISNDFHRTTRENEYSRGAASYPAYDTVAKTNTRFSITKKERGLFANMFQSILSEHESKGIKHAKETNTSKIYETTTTTKEEMNKDLEAWPEVLRPGALRVQDHSNPKKKAIADSVEYMRYAAELDAAQTDTQLTKTFTDSVMPHGMSLQDAAVYPLLLTHCMSLLTQKFKNTIAAIDVFTKVAKAGSQSYVTGCSIEAYNQLILASWAAYWDLGIIEGILEEIKNAGLTFNEDSAKILRQIQHQVHSWDSSSLAKLIVMADAGQSRLEVLNSYRERITDSIKRDLYVRTTI